ncbi:MAG: oligosaccharide flippase family protein, partial [Acidobacteriota bacterium]
MTTDDPSLGRRAARGVVWAAASVGAGKLVALVGLVVLARLLSPSDFGLVAFALVFITYVETLGDLGAGAALIYWPDRRDDAAQVSFLVNQVTGLAWFGLSWVAAPHVAAFFQTPEGASILRVMALGLPIKYLASTHDALLQRQIDFRARTAAELGFSLVKFAVAVLLAYRGFGAWSLVWGQLAGQAVSSAALWLLVPWRPRARIPSELLGPMLRYGRGLVAVNVLAAVVHHADLVIVGRMLGARALGLYQVAGKIPEATITLLIWVSGKVLFPTLSRVHAEGGSLRRPYLEAIRYVSLLTLPAVVGLILLARPLVL